MAKYARCTLWKPPTALAWLSFLPAILLLTGVSASAPAAEGVLAWHRGDNTLALKSGNATVWQFNYGTQDQTKPFFHPVAVAGGPALTEARPVDHPWHYGLWFSWKFINGTNYWEHDPKTGRIEGITEWTEPKLKTRRDFSAVITTELRYHSVNGPSVMTEHRVVRVSPPGTDGTYHLDWELDFKAGSSDVVLNRTPLPGEPGGQPWGGYAGLSARLTKGLQEAQAVSTAEIVQFTNTFRGKALGMDFSGVIDGRAQGIAIMDHPGNVNHPTPWYVIRDATMTYFSPAVINDGPVTIKAGHHLILRYRVIVHPERWSADQLQQAASAFRGK